MMIILFSVMPSNPFDCWGHTIKKSVLPNDHYVISEGTFGLENRCGKSILVEMNDLGVYQYDELIHTPESYYLYKAGSVDELDEPLKISTGNKLLIEVSFPFYVVQSLPLKGYKVRTEWTVVNGNGETCTAVSDLQFELRR